MAATKIRDAQAVQSIDLTSEVTGTLPVANGGTGVATLTGIPKASGTSAFTAATADTDYASAETVITVSNTTSWTIAATRRTYAENTGLTGAVTINNPTGSPAAGWRLWISLTGTAARAITYGTAFEDGGVVRPTTTTTTQRLDIGFIWNAATSKWRCVASGSA